MMGRHVLKGRVGRFMRFSIEFRPFILCQRASGSLDRARVAQLEGVGMRATGIRRFSTVGAAALMALMLGGGAAAAAERLVRLDAVLSPDGEPIYDAMAIGIWRMEGGEPVARVAERHAAPAEIPLEPGRYRVEAVYGDARRVTDISVPAEAEPRRTINLNAGRVRLQLLARADGPPVRGGVEWEIRRYRRGDSPGRRIAELGADRPSLWLSEGWYEVRAHHGGERVHHVVEVAAGRTYDYAIVMNQ
jgi:hypothetical protein